MATPAEILAAGGLTNADLIVQAATATGIPLAIAAAMIQKESGGKNVYGHDGSTETGPGVFSTKYGPVTINGVTYNDAGTAPVGVVSVGAAGSERQIINVAAGQVTATSTDAINGSQLYATNQAIAAAKTTVTQGDNIVVTPTPNADGSTTYQVATAKDVTFDSVIVGSVRIDKNNVA